MNLKRVIAAILCVIMFTSLTSCKQKENTSATEVSTTVSNNTTNETIAQNVFNTEAAVLNTTAVPSTHRLQQKGQALQQKTQRSLRYQKQKKKRLHLPMTLLIGQREKLLKNTKKRQRKPIHLQNQIRILHSKK